MRITIKTEAELVADGYVRTLDGSLSKSGKPFVFFGPWKAYLGKTFPVKQWWNDGNNSRYMLYNGVGILPEWVSTVNPCDVSIHYHFILSR